MSVFHFSMSIKLYNFIKLYISLFKKNILKLFRFIQTSHDITVSEREILLTIPTFVMISAAACSTKSLSNNGTCKFHSVKLWYDDYKINKILLEEFLQLIIQ